MSDLSDEAVRAIQPEPVVSGRLAKQLRLRLETLLPATMGRLAEALSNVRGELRERWPSAEDRRRALDAALAPGGMLDPLDESSVERVPAFAQAGASEPAGEPITLTLTSDDPDDLTLRQARLLGNADAILFEEAVHPAILDRAPKGRDEENLPTPMAWVRYHDQYEHAEQGAASCCHSKASH